MKRAESVSLEVIVTDDGLCMGRSLRPDIQLSAEAVGEVMAVIRSVSGDELRPGLWDSRDMPPPIPEGWQAFIEGIPTLFSALAVVVSPTSQAYMAPYAQAIGSLLLPFGTFDDEAAARVWLEPYIRDFQSRSGSIG